MNDSESAGDSRDAGKRREPIMQRTQIREALQKAIKRSAERSAQGGPSRTVDSPSNADAAIRKLRENQRLTREELDTPVTI